MERAVRLNWSLDLSSHADQLINRFNPNGYKSNSITKELLFAIVPELHELDSELLNSGITIVFPSVMSIQPGTFGILHIDWENLPEINDLKLNIPILNGDQMITRWYDLSGLPYDRIDWEFNRSNLCEADRWFLGNAEMLTNHHCVGSILLDAPHLFNSGIPHNVDGRHSKVTRSILGLTLANIQEARLLKWNERQIVIDAVASLKSNLPKYSTS